MENPQKQGPLAGVKVIDLTSVLMGPYTTQIMADLGADVIKIEGPDGDTTRALPPGPEPRLGAMFMNVNRGKRSLALDLKSPDARAIVLKLAETADIFIHSMRAQAIARLGLDYAALKAANDRIIYANLYGFSRDGPYADYPAYDDIVQAASGLAYLQSRFSGGAPTYFATVAADKVTGLTGAYAVMAALYAREKTGIGQEIEVPMFETMTSFMFIEHLNGAVFDPPLGPAEYPRATSPERRPYKTRDGYVAVLIYTDKQWRAFFDAIGNPDWSRDPMFATLTLRTENITAVLGKLSEVMKERNTEDWIKLFGERAIPAMPILSPQDLLDDPHLDAIGFWERRDTAHGQMRFPGIPTRFFETPGAIGNPGPALGSDSRSILAEAGYDEAAIEGLYESGAICA